MKTAHKSNTELAARIFNTDVVAFFRYALDLAKMGLSHAAIRRMLGKLAEDGGSTVVQFWVRPTAKSGDLLVGPAFNNKAVMSGLNEAREAEDVKRVGDDMVRAVQNAYVSAVFVHTFARFSYPH